MDSLIFTVPDDYAAVNLCNAYRHRQWRAGMKRGPNRHVWVLVEGATAEAQARALAVLYDATPFGAASSKSPG